MWPFKKKPQRFRTWRPEDPWVRDLRRVLSSPFQVISLDFWWWRFQKAWVRAEKEFAGPLPSDLIFSKPHSITMEELSNTVDGMLRNATHVTVSKEPVVAYAPVDCPRVKP